MKYATGHNMGDFFARFPGVSAGRSAEVGDDTKIWPGTHLMEGADIAADCSIGRDVHIGTDVTIGRGCKIQNGAQLFEGVMLEDEVFIGPHVVFTNVLIPRAHIDRREAFEPTIVKHGASIGANATILCGITIGEYAMIGAGAVVTEGIMEHAIVVGNPAYRIGWACECGLRLRQPGITSRWTCHVCANKYVIGPTGGLTRAP
jgi:UDP-2-acetamido-3-amino-2,3-dideoxy-glucuronate N-acetyltransferase